MSSSAHSAKANTSFWKIQNTAEFVRSAASGVAVVIMFELVNRFFENTLETEILGFYLMGLVALLSLIFVVHFLIRIRQTVDKRNYTRFITNRSERLNLMVECIKNAKQSIYILSDLSDTTETELKEHGSYIETLNQVLMNNKGREGFVVRRIVVPSSTDKLDSDWLYKKNVTSAYLDHFKLLRSFDGHSPRYRTGPQNVSVILIDDRHLFWKPELSYGEQALDSILDGGLYLEDYSHDGMKKFSSFLSDMFIDSQTIELEKFMSNKAN